MTPQPPSKKATWDLTQFSQLTSAALSHFPESHQWSEISSLSKGILVWEKARSYRVKNLGYSGAESREWFDVLPKKLCMRCDTWVGVLSWWSCQSPGTQSCGLLNHPNSFYGEMFKLSAKLDAELLLYSFNHFECDDCTVQLLTQ